MADDPSEIRDRAHMRAAVHLARRGLGTTAPNPSVGAVIVEPASGEIVGRGWTQPGGRPHAETEAITRAGARAQGATMYVTLEPCAHHGRTPPCADAIIAAGIARLVAGMTDPDPRVGGRGLDRLRAAGIAVTRGVLAEECRVLTRGHVLRVTERRPLVVVKLALAADGSAPRGAGGRPSWVTGAEARALAHVLRAEADAVLVGSATVRDDDPALTCRLPGLSTRSPARIVLAAGLDVAPTARVIAGAGEVATWCVGAAEAVDGSPGNALRERGVELIAAPLVDGGLWLPSVMEALVARGVTRLLVEGGPRVWAAFARAGLVDEVALFLAPPPEGMPTPDPEQVAHAAAARYLPRLPLAVHSRRPAGRDTLWLLRPDRPAP
jgi:diaminohydroxyphosphoribosylaminopyrimidine deaminase/5-amino-6-(5-phosphoribosylamino)uracil reductase